MKKLGSMWGFTLSLMMVVGLLSGIASADSPSSPDPSAVTASQAESQAVESGAPVAVTDEFTTTTKIFANPDGTMSADIAAGPVQVPDTSEPSGWTPIDTTLSDSGGAIEPAATAADMAFSDGGGSDLASIASGAREFSMDWGSALPAPSLSADTATYANVMPGIDLTLQARPQGFEQNLVLGAAPSSPLVVQLPLSFKGLSATLNSKDELILTDFTGKPVITSDPARMWGAALDPATEEPTVQAYVDTRIISTSTGPKLELAPDPAFFSQPGLAYPVIIDPAPDLAIDKDTYVDSSQPGQFFRNDVYLKTGSPDGTARTRSLLKFGVASLVGKYINSATTSVYGTFAASCSTPPTTVWLYELNSPGIAADTTWNNQPGTGTKYAAAAVNYGCSTGNEGWVDFNVGGASGKTMTDLVQKWANGSTNYGVRLEAANETSAAAYKKYKASESTSNRPVLHVNYSDNWPPDMPSNLGVAFTADQPVATFHSTFSDHNGGTGHAVYRVFDDSSTQVAQVSGGTVTSGSDSAATLDLRTIQGLD